MNLMRGGVPGAAKQTFVSNGIYSSTGCFPLPACLPVTVRFWGGWESSNWYQKGLEHVRYNQGRGKTTFNERRPLMEDDLQWKTTFNGRRPSMEDDLRWKTTFNGRRNMMEDDLQWKTTYDGRRPSMEYDLRWKTTYDGRHPTMEDNL